MEIIGSFNFGLNCRVAAAAVVAEPTALLAAVQLVDAS